MVKNMYLERLKRLIIWNGRNTMLAFEMNSMLDDLFTDKMLTFLKEITPKQLIVPTEYFAFLFDI